MKLSRGVLSLLTVGLILVVVAAGVGWRILSDPDANGNGSADADLPDTEGVEVASASLFGGAQPVEGALAIRDTLWINARASGEAVGYRTSEVASRTAGVVEEVFVRENQLVQAGDLLVQLDTVEAAMRLAEARAQLITSQADYQERRLRYGVDDDLLQGLPDLPSPEERDRLFRIESGLVGAEVELQRAEMEMELTRVRAPFGGRVADLVAVEGAYMGSGSEVLTLIQTDPIKVDVNVRAADLPYMEEGRGASVRFTAIRDETFDARVESVNPRLNPETRTARVSLVLPNPDNRIRVGMYATVNLEARAYPDRILIPRDAVVERGEDRREVVFMALDVNEDGEGMTEWRYVTTGQWNETHIEILPDEETAMIEPGEIVLVRGHQDISHQTAIRLVENVVAAGGRGGR